METTGLKHPPLFGLSLLSSLAAVGGTCLIDLSLGLQASTQDSLTPTLTSLGSQVSVLLPLSLGMAWVSATSPSLSWRLLILGGALVQLPLTKYVASLFERGLNVSPFAIALTASAFLPAVFSQLWLSLRHAPEEKIEDFSKPRLKPAVTPESLRRNSTGTPSSDATASTAEEPLSTDAPLALPRRERPPLPARALAKFRSKILGKGPARQSPSTKAPSSPAPAQGHAPEAPSPTPAAVVTHRAEPAPDLAPARIEASILHCELLNHAQLSKALPPAEFADLINRFLDICVETASSRQGVTDRADSESFRAHFTNPGDPDSAAQAAVLSALAIHTRLKALSEESELKCGRELDVRIGINSEDALLALFGPKSNQRAGLAGESVEWARRLASTNQLYGSRILISSQTFRMSQKLVECRPIDLLQRHLPPEAPEEVFELMAIAGTLTPETQMRLINYKKGFARFRDRQWSAARNFLKQARPVNGHDDAVDLLLHRIDEQEALADLAVDGH